MKRIIEQVYATFTARRLLIILIINTIFFVKEHLVVLLINKFLTVPDDFSNYFIDTIFVFVALCFSLWFIYLFLRKNYKASYAQIVGAIAAIFLIIYFYKKADEYDWNYPTLFVSSIEYIWLIITPLFVFLFFNFRSIIYPVKRNEEHISPKHQLVQDNPKSILEEDLLGYARVVDELFSILISQKSNKSITIGLVGPWGNGKSSIIQMLLDKLSPELSVSDKFSKIFKREFTDEYLLIHFLPYLNHQEEDLISEFFRQLSSKLRPYNGKLSNLVLEYSKRLVDVYNNNINLNFFDKHISSFEKTSAKEMYDDINERLKETEKKIIVFVDDLDRLNSKEILQVLKLIRNSADFTNVIFIVAMDKAYVIKLLTKKEEILNARFIDKFFQLEVYLPEIKKTKLREIFTKLLTENRSGFGSNYIMDVENAIGDKGNLFDDYVENIRDVKRIVNQILYEYKRLEGVIDLKDFMNYTYLKLKFPWIISFLKNNRTRVLRSDNTGKKYLLRKLPKDDSDRELDFFASLSDKVYNYEILKKYEIHKDFFKNKEEKFDPIIDSVENKYLILKTLSYLFGDDNNLDNVNSIRNIRNFMMLMEQRVFDDYLDESELDNLFSVTDNEINEELKKLKEANKTEQVLDRLSYFSVGVPKQMERALNILGLLYQKHRFYNLYEQVISDVIVSIINGAESLVKEEPNRKEEFKNAIINGLLNSTMLLSKTKIEIILDLFSSQNILNHLGFKKSRIIHILSDHYDKYLTENDGVTWNVNESEFHRIYYDIIEIEEIKNDVHSKLRDFWERNSIKMLCAQSLNFSNSSLKAFVVSDVVVEIFGSFMGFKRFVENHKESCDPEIIEYINFLNISMFTDFRFYIIFEFKKFHLMIKRIKSQEGNTRIFKTDQFENKQQLLFLHDDPKLNGNIISSLSWFDAKGFTNARCFGGTGWFSLFLTVQNPPNIDMIKEAAEQIKLLSQINATNPILVNQVINEEDLFSEQPFISNDYTMHLFSIQPYI